MEQHMDLTELTDRADVPKEYRSAVASLMQGVADGRIGRRDFMVRTASLGLSGALATELLASSTAHAAAPISSHGGGIAARYKNKTIGVPMFQVADQNEVLIVDQFRQITRQAGLNWKWLADDTQGNQQRAQTTIDSYVTRGVDGMFLLVIPTRWVPAQLAAAAAKHIPVIGMNNFSPLFPALTFEYGPILGSDAVFLAEYMVLDQMQRHPTGKIKVGALNVPVDVVQDRVAVFKGIIGLNPRFEIAGGRLTEVDVTNVAASTTQATEALLEKYPDLNCVWSPYPPMAVPCASAVAQVGKSSQVQVYGHVAQSAGLGALRDPSNPLTAISWVDLVFWSYQLIEYMLDIFAGRIQSRFVQYQNPIPAAVIDKHTVDRVQKVMVNGKLVDTWMFDNGSYRPVFIERWKRTYTS
jgi:ABC-type sugar transport system substrate-binding protein